MWVAAALVERAVPLLCIDAHICRVSAGVASGFLKVGSALAAQRGQPIAAAAGASGDKQAVGNGDPAPPASSGGMFDKGAYFIGKAVWGKGYGTLLQRMKEAKDAGSSFHLDCFGKGEDLDEVCRCCSRFAVAGSVSYHQSLRSLREVNPRAWVPFMHAKINRACAPQKVWRWL